MYTPINIYNLTRKKMSHFFKEKNMTGITDKWWIASFYEYLQLLQEDEWAAQGEHETEDA